MPPVTGEDITKKRRQPRAHQRPILRIADGLNTDGELAKYYQRGLNYAIQYFGNYGPYYIYLLGPDSEQSVRDIYHQRAVSRVNTKSKQPAGEQIEAFLKQPNIVAEIRAVLAGKAEGGLTWTQRLRFFTKTSRRMQDNDNVTRLKTPGEPCMSITMFFRWPIAIPLSPAPPTNTSTRGWLKEWHPTVRPSSWKTLALSILKTTCCN